MASHPNYIEYYADVKSAQPFSLREKVRGLALDAMSLMSSESQMKRPRIQFIYIHHIFKDEIPALRQLLNALSAQFDFISHSEAVRRIWEDDIDRPYVSISSDDGFKNNLDAAQVFEEFGVSACFFVNPALIDEQDFLKIETHCREKLHFPPVEFLTWKDIESLKSMGQEIGSHTMSHMRVSAHEQNKVHQDLDLSRQLLLKNCGQAEHFAWPYGLFSDFNSAGVKSVFELGYQSCSSAERGAHISTGVPVKKEELCIRRDHIVLDWKPSHIQYFLRKSAAQSSAQHNLFPY